MKPLILKIFTVISFWLCFVLLVDPLGFPVLKENIATYTPVPHSNGHICAVTVVYEGLGPFVKIANHLLYWDFSDHVVSTFSRCTNKRKINYQVNISNVKM